MPDLSDRMREASRRRALRSRWIGLGVVAALAVTALIYYQVPQRLLDAAGLRCGAGSGWEAAESLEVSDLFQEWDQAETSGDYTFDDGSVYHWDYAEEVAEVEELATAIGAEPILLHLQPVIDEPHLVAADTRTFVVNNPGGYFESNDRTVRVDFAAQETEWAYDQDVPRVALAGPAELTQDRYVGLHQRTLAGDQAQLELRSYDLPTGDVAECIEVLGPLDADVLSGRHPSVLSEVTAVGDDQFLVHLHDRSAEGAVMDSPRWLGLYNAADGALVWETEIDAAAPSLDADSAIAVTDSGAVVLSWLPAPRYISAPVGRLDGTVEYQRLELNARLHAEELGERVNTAEPGSVVPSEAYDLGDGSLLWSYPGAEDAAVSLPAVPHLGEDAPGAAVMLRGEVIPEDEVHDPGCTEGAGQCPIAWSVELVDDDGAALWSTQLPVGSSPGAWAMWGDTLIRQEDESWGGDYEGHGSYGELSAYDLAAGDQLWTLEGQHASFIDQAVEAQQGWLVFDEESGDPPANMRIIDAQTGEVAASGGDIRWTRGLQAEDDYIVVQFGDLHTAVLERH